MVQRGVVLFAHGSRDPLWKQPVEAISRRVAELDASVQVRCAYLEWIDPDLSQCVEDLATSGVQQITIVPLFLGVGRHAREDLPRLVTDLATRHPALEFSLQPSIGEQPALIELVAQLVLSR